MPVIHRSKIDTWLLLVLVAAIAAASVGIVSAILAGGRGLWWAVLIPGSLGIVLPLWVLLNTSYTIDQDLLRIRSGPFRWKVPLAEITRITSTSNPLSSPALSLDRLRIDYSAGRTIMVSPEDIDQFIRDIESVRGSKLSYSRSAHRFLPAFTESRLQWP